ncbi:MAG: hypothetical protein ACRDPK_18030 [Carbonactinosporaceae bacterium]
MIYPLVRELAAGGIPMVVRCRVLKIARQPYYRWLANPITLAELEEAYLANAIFDAHRDDPPSSAIGSLADEVREVGRQVALRTVRRICSEICWWSSFGKTRCGKGARVGPPVHVRCLAFSGQRDFCISLIH